MQKRLERVPNGSPLSQAYPPESLNFESTLPGPARRVVVLANPPAGDADAAALPAAVEALSLADAPVSAPRRGAYRGHARGGGRPANQGQRQPPLDALFREMEEEDRRREREKKRKEKQD